MLRLVRPALPAVRLLAAQRVHPRRGLVSPVLLTRTWENENVGTLRKEAKGRGLSAKGSRANLILRITEHDAKDSPEHAPLSPLPDTRCLSSTFLRSNTVAPGPGVPPDMATSAPPPPYEIFSVVIPDPSHPIPEAPVKVPYVPDFWDSKASPKEPEVTTEDLPKVVLVGGVSTYHGDGPTHNLETVSETVPIITPSSSEAKEPLRKLSGKGGLLDDISEDLGIPPPGEIKQSIWKMFS